MLSVVTLMDLTLAHVKLDILEMAKVAMVCCLFVFFESVDVLLCFCLLLKVPLIPNFFFLLIKSTRFPDFTSEKLISIEKILAFLQAFELVISRFTTAQSGIWVGPLVTSLREPR